MGDVNMKEKILNWCTSKPGVITLLIFANLLYLMILKRGAEQMDSNGQMYIALKILSVIMLIAYYLLSKKTDMYLDGDYFIKNYPVDLRTHTLVQNHFWRMSKGYDIPSVMMKVMYYLSTIGGVFYLILAIFSIDNFDVFTNLCVPHLLNATIAYIIIGERKEYLHLKRQALYNWVITNDKEGKIEQ